jgi:hypothetical protein
VHQYKVMTQSGVETVRCVTNVRPVVGAPKEITPPATVVIRLMAMRIPTMFVDVDQLQIVSRAGRMECK